MSSCHEHPPSSGGGTGNEAAVRLERDSAEKIQEKLHVFPQQLTQNWKDADTRARDYLVALGIPESQCSKLARRAVEAAATTGSTTGDALEQTFHHLKALLIAADPIRAEAGRDLLDTAFQEWRLRHWFAQKEESSGVPDVLRPSAVEYPWNKPLTRRPMLPEHLERSSGFRRWLRRGGRCSEQPEQNSTRRTGREFSARPWRAPAQRRRSLLIGLILVPSIVAGGFMANVLPQRGGNFLEISIVLAFAALFGWISIGFWTALAGFGILLRRDRFAITHCGEELPDPDSETRTAVLMPICDEPVERVFAGLKAIHRSLERTGTAAHFDFFVLSDTADPETWMREEQAWAEWCREVHGFGRIFYRRRKVRLKRKSGNVADFCRRWGEQYRYMILLDADSIMTGSALVRLVQLMENRPEVAVIQTAPRLVNRTSLFARLQQFANHVYAPLLEAGLHYWQLGQGQYWGHNAILRVAPFMQHCGLSRLPGHPPLGGEIMSHDFVEAALLGRAGWELWLAFDLPGSYEEPTSTLLEEMNRDRRWCQGNLQHLRLVWSEGLFPAHRALLLNGALSYVSALLWFGFLILNTAQAIVQVMLPPDYFPTELSLFPAWPVWHPDWAISLLAVTLAILFLPKVLAVLWVAGRRSQAKGFGGACKLGWSTALETLISSFLAPVRMVFYSKFVLLNLLGRPTSWDARERHDNETSWREALRRHSGETLIASAWGLGVFWLNPDFFWWLTPVIGALFLSIPLSVWASRVRFGKQALRLGLFGIPEEQEPPRELLELRNELQAVQHARARCSAAERDGFVRAVLNPRLNALRCALAGRARRLRPSIRAARQAFLVQALHGGPAALAPHEKRILLSDPEMLRQLHFGVWQSAERSLALWAVPETTTRAL